MDGNAQFLLWFHGKIKEVYTAIDWWFIAFSIEQCFKTLLTFHEILVCSERDTSFMMYESKKNTCFFFVSSQNSTYTRVAGFLTGH